MTTPTLPIGVTMDSLLEVRREFFKRGLFEFCVVTLDCGLCRLTYRPINPRTGQAWQASHNVAEAYDCHLMYNSRTQECSEVVAGPVPEGWWSPVSAWDSCRAYVSSPERAFSYIPAAQQISNP